MIFKHSERWTINEQEATRALKSAYKENTTTIHLTILITFFISLKNFISDIALATPHWYCTPVVGLRKCAGKSIKVS